MRLNLPIYVCENGSGLDRSFVLRPLFARTDVEVSHADLRQGLLTLQKILRAEAASMSKEYRTVELASWAYFPDWKEERIHVRVAIGKLVTQTKALVVTWKSGEQSVAMLPACPGLWFDPLDDPSARASEVLSKHFRATGEHPLMLEELAEADESITTLELDLALSPELPAPRSLLAMFGPPEEKLSGSEQLERVGRRIDTADRNEANRAHLRDREVEEIHRLLYGTERRAVLLVGPPKSGKTAIIHEMVHLARARRKKQTSQKRSVFLISPQRLISGMSYVGQWEARLLAIIQASKSARHILYFDDLPGLLNAGKSAQSDLNVAMVLRPYLERRELRIVAEITPQALRILRERDRAFADLFHLVPVRETGDAETLRILTAAAQSLEAFGQYRVRLNCLPEILSICRRFMPESSFPGKAVDLLRSCAALMHNCTESGAWYTFAQQRGLGNSFADERGFPRMTLNTRTVIAQKQPIETVQSRLLLASTDLRDPERPAGVFLFVGPTGVGKTQLATMLSLQLFNSPGRLLRFDMNEFCGPDAVARLAGTFHQPEGLLTSAIRQKPMSVLLLDEIEKADPGVFDLLLQVLGEGRLTDALGRTADFTNAIIVMTSNLGVREDMSRAGFGTNDAGESEQHYISAVRRFFRPEFFNRLDAIVPFHALSQEDILLFTRMQLRRLTARPGFSQRRYHVQLDKEAEHILATQGYDRKMGARALKRTVERLLVQPLARTLAERPGDAPIVIHGVARNGTIDLRVLEFQFARALPEEGSEVTPATITGYLEEIHAALEPLQPAGAFSLNDPPAGAVFYYTLQEKVGWIEREFKRALRRTDRGDGRRPAMGNVNRQAQNPLRKIQYSEARLAQMMRDQFPMRNYLDMLAEPVLGKQEVSGMDELAGECAVVLSMIQSGGSLAEETYLVVMRDNMDFETRMPVLGFISQCLRRIPGITVRSLNEDEPDNCTPFHYHEGMDWTGLMASGIGIGPALQTLRGITLTSDPGERLKLLQCDVLKEAPMEKNPDKLVELLETRVAPMEELQVIRLVSHEGILDVRTGIITQEPPGPDAPYKILGATLLGGSHGA